MGDGLRLVGGALVVAALISANGRGVLRYPVDPALWLAALLACVLSVAAALDGELVSVAIWVMLAGMTAQQIGVTYDPTRLVGAR